MNPLKKVLLVADMSAGWESAVETAIELEDAFDTEVVPVHVVPQSLEGALDLRELRQAIDGRLRKMIRRRGADGNPFTDTIVTIGTRFRRIAAVADDLAVDAILIGAGDSGQNETSAVGATTSRVVRHARRPVWVTRPGDRTRPRKILCPVDMSGPSERALRTAVALAEAFEAELIVLHVIRSLASLHRSETELRDRAQLERDHAFERRARFQRLIECFDFKDADWWAAVREGDPCRQIAQAVRENVADLIVMGTRGRYRLPELQIGGVIAGVLGRLPCSTIAAHSESPVRDELGQEIAAGWELVEVGRGLLAEGRAQEAAGTFESAITASVFCGPAWEGLADAQDALGLVAESTSNRGLARLIAERP